MHILHEYIPKQETGAKRRGLSERHLRKRLEHNGWDTWRGGSLSFTRKHRYPVVLKKYEKLRTLLEREHPLRVSELYYICEIHQGMPDLICYRDGHFKFVECKLGHEQLSKRQKACIIQLGMLGFHVEVHKLVGHCTKIRRASIDLTTGEKIIHEHQMTLSKYR